MKKLLGVLLTMAMVIMIALFTMNQGKAAKKGDNKVYLYIPIDKKFDGFILVNGNADAHVENVKCENLQIDAAIGTVDIVGFTTIDANIILGMGTINAEGKIAGNAEVTMTI